MDPSSLGRSGARGGNFGAFAGGLAVGLVVGLLAGAFLSPFLGFKTPLASPGTANSGMTAEERAAAEGAAAERGRGVPGETDAPRTPLPEVEENEPTPGGAPEGGPVDQPG